MKRFVQFSKGMEYTSPAFPFDAPVQFNIENKFFTPVPDLLNFINDAFMDTPLSLFTALPSALDTGAKFFGVSLRPRGFYTQAWQDTDPLSFTVTLDLKFGWNGQYSGKDEIYDPVNTLIDQTLPRMENDTLIHSPGPSSVELVQTAMGNMIQELRNTLGVLEGLLPKQEQTVLDIDMTDSKNAMIACYYDPNKTPPDDIIPIGLVTGAKGGKEGDPDVLVSSPIPPAFSGAAQIGAHVYSKMIHGGRVPRSYSINTSAVSFKKDNAGNYSASEETLKGNFLGADLSEDGKILPGRSVKDLKILKNRADFTEDTIRSTPQGKAHNYARTDVLLFPITPPTNTEVPVPQKYGEGIVEEVTIKTGIWKVIFNEKIILQNLILNSLTYSFSNEQDSQGYPIGAVVNVNFITQEIPVTHSDGVTTNFMG